MQSTPLSSALNLNAADELAKMWPIFAIRDDDPISLRAISPKGAAVSLPARNITFTASELPEIRDRQQAFGQEAIRLNGLGYNVYTLLNPIKPSFEGDGVNGKAVSDDYVACRRLLLIDLDRTGALVASATDAEIEEAATVADDIADALSFGGATDQPFRVMSGNGIHLYVRLHDFQNDPASKRMCQSILRALAQQFNTETIKVDTSVFNAARITKVPGTIARKGVATLDRPFRMAHVL